MLQAHRLSSQDVKHERAKAERANFIVSEVISDPRLMSQAVNGIEALNRDVCLYWPEFLHWERSRQGISTDTSKRVEIPMKFEPRVTPRARDVVVSLDPDERAAFEQHLAALCSDPFIDNVTKFSAPYPPVVLCLYQDGPFRIIYRLTGGAIVDLLNVSWAPDVPPIDEWDNWQSK